MCGSEDYACTRSLLFCKTLFAHEWSSQLVWLSCQSQANCAIQTLYSCRRKKIVDGKFVSFDSVFEEALKCL